MVLRYWKRSKRPVKGPPRDSDQSLFHQELTVVKPNPWHLNNQHISSQLLCLHLAATWKLKTNTIVLQMCTVFKVILSRQKAHKSFSTVCDSTCDLYKDCRFYQNICTLMKRVLLYILNHQMIICKNSNAVKAPRY